jgi:phage shock protein PspC (stress-responsive transcriptional regulator)
MEKVFQIHLAGVLFTIEEQAYLHLKSYLDRMHAHFVNNSEVVQDIEGRMAELFAQKLGSNRTTLFTKDVNEVTNTLGNIDQMDEHGEMHNKQPENKIQNPAHRKLRRSATDQNLGGVCSGIASFFDVDPVMVRVLFVIMMVLYGSGILLYLVLWVVLPEAKGEEAEYMKLQRLNKTKRLFRDAESRMIGGVSAGLSSYFGIDRTWIRLGFVLSVFLFGTGFWLYIILWIIVPKAVSASDKLLMRGESVDIRSIEKEVLQNQGSNKINNFALHGNNVLGKIIKGTIKLVGSFIAFVLFCLIVGISVAMIAIFFNLGQTQFINELIAFTIKDVSITYAAKIGVLLTIISPVIGLLLVVIKALFKIKIINKTWAFTLLGLFLIGVGCLTYSGVSFAATLSKKESALSITRIAAPDTLFLEGIEMPFNNDEENNNLDNDMEMVFQDKGILMGKNQFFLEIDHINIKQSKSDSVTLKIVRRANGSNQMDAKRKMDMIIYTPKIIGNKIIIPSYFSLNKDQQFSWQELDVTLYVPEKKMINMDMNVKDILDAKNMNQADGDYYQFVSGELICMNCLAENDQPVESEEETTDEEANIDFNIKDGDNNVNMEIKISNDGHGNSVKTKKITKKDGKEITIEETKSGNTTIKKRTEK